MGIAENLKSIRDEIGIIAERAGRAPNDVRILAATKHRNVHEIMAAVDAGIDLIGENTVQEALGKFEFLPDNLERHMIGTLQPNKTKPAVQLFDCIQSVTSLELAQEIEHHAPQADTPYPVLIEVNPADEATKRGLSIDDARALASEIGKLERLRVDGLMAMMPHAEDLEALRPHFRAMKTLFDSLNDQFDLEMTTLSMGMSHDYPIAVEEGSTLIRLGTRLFGPRERR